MIQLRSESMEKNRTRKKNVLKFLVCLASFAVLCWIRYFDHTINPQDTTAFAFTYRYGFISRGLMGTLLEMASSVTGKDLVNYETVYLWSAAATFLFFLCLFGFFYTVLMRVKEEQLGRVQLLVIMVSVFSFPMFVTEENFGRLDVYLTILMLLCVILLLREKAEWLVIPLCVLGVLIHQGFVFMNVNLILVLLFYKWQRNEGKRRRYYLVLLGLTFFSVSILFLYFEFFSHVNGMQIYDEVVRNAKHLAADGKTYSTALVNHEILGEGVFMDEWFFHKINYAELPQFLIFFAPYLFLAVWCGKQLWKQAKSAADKWICAAVLLGAWTVLPEFVLKVDYGRYMYELVFYYLSIALCLCALGDRHVLLLMETVGEGIKKRMVPAVLLIVYPMILMPFYDVVISELNVTLCRLMNMIS